ncbi:MAG: hypothetical protein AAF242_00180 [Bacteroidota bacterium]
MKNKIIRFHSILSTLKIRDQKQNILHGYGVESTKDLTEQQLDEIIQALDQKVTKRYAQTSPETRTLRSKVLAVLTKMGIYEDNGNWEKVNAFMMQPRIAGKLIYEHDDEELKQLIKKLYSMQKKRTVKIQEENYKAANN